MGLGLNSNYLYTGKVFHMRYGPKIHSLKNSVFYLRFPLSQINEMKNCFFSINSWNLLSFYNKDHGQRDGSDLWLWAINQLKKSGITEEISEIELQTFPRIFGYILIPSVFGIVTKINQLLPSLQK